MPLLQLRAPTLNEVRAQRLVRRQEQRALRLMAAQLIELRDITQHLR